MGVSALFGLVALDGIHIGSSVCTYCSIRVLNRHIQTVNVSDGLLAQINDDLLCGILQSPTLPNITAPIGFYACEMCKRGRIRLEQDARY